MDIDNDNGKFNGISLDVVDVGGVYYNCGEISNIIIASGFILNYINGNCPLFDS